MTLFRAKDGYGYSASLGDPLGGFGDCKLLMELDEPGANPWPQSEVLLPSVLNRPVDFGITRWERRESPPQGLGVLLQTALSAGGFGLFVCFANPAVVIKSELEHVMRERRFGFQCGTMSQR